jgi:hypothetical protein
MDNPMLAWVVLGLGVVLVLISLFADPLAWGGILVASGGNRILY